MPSCPRVEERASQAARIPNCRQHQPRALPAEPQQRWRSMFVDEIEAAVFTDDPWGTADNYSLSTNAIDQVELAIAP